MQGVRLCRGLKVFGVLGIDKGERGMQTQLQNPKPPNQLQTISETPPQPVEGLGRVSETLTHHKPKPPKPQLPTPQPPNHELLTPQPYKTLMQTAREANRGGNHP